MKNAFNLSKYSIILSIIPTIYYAFFHGKIIVISIICSYPLIIWLLHTKIKIDIDGKYFLYFFLLYNYIVLARGIINAKSDEDWKLILGTYLPLYLFIYNSIFLALNKYSVLKLVHAFYVFGLPASILIYFLTFDPGPLGFSRFLSPLNFMIFIVPYMNKKFGLFVFVVSVFTIYADISIRSVLINNIVGLLIVLTFFVKDVKIVTSIFRSIRFTLLLLPVLFLILGSTGIFNVFKIGENVNDFSIEDNKGNSQEVFVDSRTSIYQDVFKEIYKDYNHLIFGLGSTGKTDTSLFDDSLVDYRKSYKEGRPNTESGMLNFIQWGGLLGGLLYFLLFFKSSYLGIYNSNNWFCKMLGVWIAYKGLFSFLEDSLLFAPSSIFIFLPIGICLSKSFRPMTDFEINNLFKRKLKLKWLV